MHIRICKDIYGEIYMYIHIYTYGYKDKDVQGCMGFRGLGFRV